MGSEKYLFGKIQSQKAKIVDGKEK